MLKIGTLTKWGQVDHITKTETPGAYWISTPSHGALVMESVLLDGMSAGHELRSFAVRSRCSVADNAGRIMLEEDCDYTLGVLAIAADADDRTLSPEVAIHALAVIGRSDINAALLTRYATDAIARDATSAALAR